MDWQPVIITTMAKSASIPGLNQVVKNDTLHIKVQEKARLSLSAKIVEPAGAIDDSVSPGQIFKLQALVRNQPEVTPVQGQGEMVLRKGQAFEIVDANGNAQPDDSVRVFNEGEAVYWWIKVLENTSRISKQTSRVGHSIRERLKLLENNDWAPEILASQILQDNQLEIEVTKRPLDQNSGQPAFIQNGRLIKTLFISQKASVTITSLPDDTLSTGQNFAFNVTIEKSDNVINPYLIIKNPSQKLGSNPEPISVGPNNRAIWNFTVPVDYSGSGSEIIDVQLIGIDENSGLQVVDQKQTQLTIQLRAKLALSEPQIDPLTVANTGLLSQGQQLTISLKPIYSPVNSSLKYADLKGTGSIALDTTILKQGFTLVAGTQVTQTFSDTGQVLSWTIKAPYEILTASLNFNFDQPPLDANLNQPVDLDKDLSKIAIPIRVRQKTITISTEPLDIADTSLTKAQSNVPLMSVVVSNKEFDDLLHVSGLTFAFYGTNDVPDASNLLSNRALIQMIKSIRVIDYTDYQGVAKPTVTYADFVLTDSSANPLQIHFDPVADIAPKSEAKFMVVADFQNNVVNRMFRTQLQGVQAYDFDPEKPLKTADTQGNSLTESTELISKPFTLVSTDPKEAFGNFPNPFGRQHPYTNIAFLLEQNSNVEIKIFTLTGELVWSKSLTGLQRGFYDRLVQWDGRNDKGQRVLNGVYLCTIDIKPLGGGASKRYITKIAYIK